MSTYEPGTVAQLSIHRESVRAILRGDEWLIVGHSFFKSVAVGNDKLIQSVRPLVVLDLDDPKRLYADLCAAISACGNGAVAARLSTFAGEVRELMRPPRIPEPGLWGVVSVEREDDLTDYWTNGPGGWFNERGETLEWASLPHPALVRDGIEDGAR